MSYSRPLQHIPSCLTDTVCGLVAPHFLLPELRAMTIPLFASMTLATLDNSSKWNRGVFVFRHLAYFTQHNTFKFHPCCHRLQNFLFSFFLVKGWIVFPYMYVPCFLYPLICEQTFKFFPHLGNCERYYSEHGSTNISSRPWFQFFLINIQKSDCWTMWSSTIFWGTSILFFHSGHTVSHLHQQHATPQVFQSLGILPKALVLNSHPTLACCKFWLRRS